MRIDRMLSIVVMLLNRDRITARELAEKNDIQGSGGEQAGAIRSLSRA